LASHLCPLRTTEVVSSLISQDLTQDLRSRPSSLFALASKSSSAIFGKVLLDLATKMKFITRTNSNFKCHLSITVCPRTSSFIQANSQVVRCLLERFHITFKHTNMPRIHILRPKASHLCRMCPTHSTPISRRLLFKCTVTKVIPSFKHRWVSRTFGTLSTLILQPQ
jgi:hypothetical protein